MHFGIDGEWPESGQRWQTVKKHGWAWDSRQRTQAVHVGVPGRLYLDVATAGEHVIQVSMREDGFELDRILLTTDTGYTPEGSGPQTRVFRGTLPNPYPVPEDYQEAALDPGQSHLNSSRP